MWGGTLAKAGSRGLLAAAIVAGVFAVTSLHASGAQGARGLELGVYDPEFKDPDAATRTLAFDRSVQARAGIVLIPVHWRDVAPGVRPPGFVATNPADSAYDWASTDAAVQDAAARGLKILMKFTWAPQWAEGPGRPSQAEAPAGTWRPNPSDVGDFARAISTRYSGNFMGLPAVRYWQLWSEPNLNVYLEPQFEGNRPTSPDVYRAMLNAFYTNLKAVSPQNVVITGGTSPYGDALNRVRPVAFWRQVLCVQEAKKKKRKKGKKKGAPRPAFVRAQNCPAPVRFDVLAHNPINTSGGPRRAAHNPDDASSADLDRIVRVLRGAEAAGTVLPGRHPIWATEIWWDSNPPNSAGAPLGVQARWIEEEMYLLWKDGASVMLNFRIRDTTGHTDIKFGNQSGIFFIDGQPKPSYTAFRFPFVTERLGKNRVRAWGEAPGPGPVKIQIRRGHRYRNLSTLKAGSNRVFVGVLRLGRKARLRARQGSETSLVWKQN